MKRGVKATIAAVVIVAFVLVFLFAPVVYLLSLGSGINVPGSRVPTPVYVSIGCKTIGFGTIYSPRYGVALACSVGNAPWILPA
jgi:hypothetical protein